MSETPELLVPDAAAWRAWLESLDRGFVFLLLLPFVVAVVGLWAERARKQ
jgi:hypothetical protein